MKKRILSLFLAFMLAAGLLPTPALAADADWAKSAVEALDDIYGPNIFSANDDEVMTRDKLMTLAEETEWNFNGVTLPEGEAALTRGKACEVLADVFGLPVNGSAIEYLHEKNIISGKADGNLDVSGTVSLAEFAVLTYRVLNFVGSGFGSSVKELKPGTDAYFAWMYLAARKCVPMDVEEATLTAGIGDENTIVETVVLAEDNKNWITANKGGEELWNAWAARLKTTDGLTEFAPEYPYSETSGAGAEAEAPTVLDAAVAMVNAAAAVQGKKLADLTIFSDVVLGDYAKGGAYYDGVMYLFDQGLVSGTGDGTFEPNTELPRFQLAMMLARLSGQQMTLAQAINSAVTNGYMSGATVAEGWQPGGGDEWNNTATREEAIIAIMKQQGVDSSKVNTDILDRFTGSTVTSTLPNAAAYIAYAVSIGLVNGTGDGSLALSGQVDRGQFGVLVYRTLLGVDETKMHDYGDLRDEVLTAAEQGGGSTEPGEGETAAS